MRKGSVNTFFLISFVLLFSLGGGVFAKNQMILFWSENCPYCHIVKGKIEEEDIKEVVTFEEIELDGRKEKTELFSSMVKECNVDPSIPMLYVGGKCYQGVEPIMSKLRGIVSGEELEEPAPIEQKEKTKGQANTEKLILIVLGFLIALPIFGYFVKSRRGKKVGVIASLLLLPLFFATPVKAVCPLCTVAVGAGVGLSRSLGIDDTIVGVWIGGLLISSSLWLADWIQKKKFAKKVSGWVWVLASLLLMYAFALIPMKITGLIGIPNNTLFGIDKVLLGVVLGSIMFFLGSKLHTFLKEKNKGKVFFPYQKVVIPVASLLIATIILYFIVY